MNLHPPKDRERARWTVKNLVRQGRVRRDACVFGRGCRGKLEAHHPDYEQPALFYWVCKRHHDDMHWRGAHLPPSANPVAVAPPKRDLSAKIPKTTRQLGAA